MLVKKYNKLIHQILFFLIVGLITLGIDVFVATTLYNVFNFPAYLASAIGFMSGFFFNFPMNRKKVFHHSDNDKFSLHSQVAMFILLSVFNLLATSVIVELIVSSEITSIQYAKIFVTALIAVWNFILFKLVIFSKKN